MSVADGSEAGLGVDIGGTFTDVVLERGGKRWSLKVLTTHGAPDDAVVEGVSEVCRRAGIVPADLTRIVHGATLATNALIERRGARSAFITTEGFRDVIEMRTESRFEQYDLDLRLPEPLIPRNDRFTLRERLDAGGNVLTPLDGAEVEALAARLGGYESVAIGFLHAYLDLAHERRAAEIIQRRQPHLSISLSSDVSPQMREYERFSTTCANAYVKPMMAAYLGRLAERLAGIGARCPIRLIHSGGGIMSLEDAARLPVRLIESGPAGGAIYAADFARRHGIGRALSFDMGGTTAKICLVRDGAPKTARVFEAARSYRFKKGSGMPISIPVVDMVEIGAGGGSLAAVDALGRIQVGPESAGSEPGPACYGRGGARPAVTDADLVLGRLDPDAFAGGAMKLDRAAAERALEAAVGGALGLPVGEAARGVSEMVDEAMASAARVHAVECGEDLADYTMIAFGGAAPLHAGRLCETLGIDRFLVPPGAGVGSAIGFLRAPYAFEATRSLYMRLSAFDAAAAKGALADLLGEALAFVHACAPGAETVAERKVFMRYVGQGWEIPVEVSQAMAEAPTPDDYLAAFEAAYSALFGRTVAGLDVEIAVWAATASTLTPPPPTTPPPPEGAAAGSSGRRAMLDPKSGAKGEGAVVDRAALTDGAFVAGPAFVTETETTIVVPAGFTAIGRADGTIDVRRVK
mgnify:CR=1 FL=1